MNFSYGVIAAVGVLVAISLALISASPDDVIEPRMMKSDEKLPTLEKTLPSTLTVSIPDGVGVPGCEHGGSVLHDGYGEPRPGNVRGCPALFVVFSFAQMPC